MATLFVLAATLLLLLFHVPTFAIASVHDINTDQSSLLPFKHHISDPNHILSSNWSSASPVCHWIGITCGSSHLRVIGLNLSHMDLVGTVPPHLGNLSFLVDLDLSNNSFYGSLPRELAQLRRLKRLVFRFNDFSGEMLSWIVFLPKLQVLSAGHNSLSGAIPASLFNMTSLQKLAVGNNKFGGILPLNVFTSSSLQYINFRYNLITGSIPPIILNNSPLQFISFSHNNLSGELPDHIFDHLPNLKELYLQSNQLSGNLPLNLFNCMKLEYLALSSNRFGGNLPLNVFNSSSLQFIYIGDNLITGSIPPIILNNSPLQIISFYSNNLLGELPDQIFHHLHNLKWLDLYENKFSGNLPLSLFSCKKLEILWLSSNQFEGYIPRAIGNLTMLKLICLSDNNFQPGKNTIPNEIGYLRNLEIMNFYRANLRGNIPLSLFNISTLKEITLGDNQLSGTLPSSIGSRLLNLEVLLLWKNHLSGKIPNSLANATKLRYLDLDGNLFSCQIPNIFGNLRNLERLYLGEINVTIEPSNPELSLLNSLTNCKYLRRLAFVNMKLNSILPSSVGNLSTSLEDLAFENCKIKGRIPENIGNLSGLISMKLNENELIRSIPIGLQKLNKLQGLTLDVNNLEGLLPHELCQLEHLDVLDLSFNKFSGPVPTCLGNITTLREVYLSNNNFDSTILSTLWDLSDLIYLDLESNKLKGSLAPKMSNLKVVIYVSLSKNQLSGGIPSTIGELKDLQYLSLAQNRFEGPIPESFGGLVSLELLDLSNNNLSGVIPKSMEALLYLKSFNVSFNYLKGQIPISGPFENFSAQSFLGNKELCGAPRLQLPKCKVVASRQSYKTTIIMLKFVLPVLVSIVIVLIVIYVLVKCQKQKKQSIIEVDATVAMLRRISYYELQQATNGFANANLLGIGSFGKVYKGILLDGENIAIKVFDLEKEGAFRSFDVECEVFCNVRHRNPTKIISNCSNFDFKALVLSYKSNGSLEKWLHSHDHCLSIIQRLNIVIDVAVALDYLHHRGPIPIIHCDLKPNNVLLDENMVAYVTDFGISKLMDIKDSFTQTMTLATMGYMAPEYGLEGIISRQGDIYSYGILLVETFTGKKPIHEMFEGELSIKQWVKESYPDAIMNIIDPKLLIGDQCQFHIKRDCLVSIIGLALDCSADLPSERENIKNALVALEKIKMRFLNDIGDLRMSMYVC